MDINGVINQLTHYKMNRSEAKEMLPIIQAFAEGKEIEFRSKGFDEEWKKVNEIPGLSYSSFDYRVKSEPKYRPFKNADECWQEMLKHQPFGWVKRKGNKPSYELLACISKNNENNEAPVCFASYGSVDRGVVIRSSSRFDKMFNVFTFADGASFGAKEE